MRVRISRVTLLCHLLISLSSTEAFTTSPPRGSLVRTALFASTQQETSSVTSSKPKTQQLGLLTFDLDDTLYPIELVVRAANGTLGRRQV